MAINTESSEAYFVWRACFVMERVVGLVCEEGVIHKILESAKPGHDCALFFLGGGEGRT